MSTEARKNQRRTRHVSTNSVLAALALLASSLLWLAPPASAAKEPYGIVPLGNTNEGFRGGSNSSTTGILVISGGPCIGPVITHQKEERLATRITLYHGATVIARWEIYGEQQIAWVEPIGHYSVSASDFQNGAKVSLNVTSAKNALVNMNPGCL